MQINIELRKEVLWDECSRCEGECEITVEKKGSDVEIMCPDCKGEGKIPSDFGEAILELIKKGDWRGY